MSDTKAYPEVIRKQVDRRWALLLMWSVFITFGFFLYCLFNWTFTWWLAIFAGITFLLAHRYGTLLDKAAKKHYGKQESR